MKMVNYQNSPRFRPLQEASNNTQVAIKNLKRGFDYKGYGIRSILSWSIRELDLHFKKRS